jgi:hypothetical protein
MKALCSLRFSIPLHGIGVLCVVLLHGSTVLRATAQAPNRTATWLNGSGSWSDASQWDSDPDFPENVPEVDFWKVTIGGGNAIVDANISITELVLTGGTISGAGDLVVNGPVSWTGGNMEGDGMTILNGNATISGDNTKSLTRTLINNGLVTFSEGTIRGDFLLGANFENRGILELSGEASFTTGVVPPLQRVVNVVGAQGDCTITYLPQRTFRR